MKCIDIVHCFDHNYVLPAGVSFYSLLEHAKRPETQYRIHVVSADLTNNDKSLLKNIVGKFNNGEIEFHAPPQLSFRTDEVLRGTHFSAALFYKMMLPEMFAHCNEIIVSDVDTIYGRDIADVLDMVNGDQNYYIASTWDPCYARWHKVGLIPDGRICIEGYAKNFSAEERDKLRVNAGLMVFNIKNILYDGIPKKWIEETKRSLSRLHLPEQDIFNLVCYPRIHILNWDALAHSYWYPDYLKMTDEQRKQNSVWDMMYKNPVQIHYITRDKPWNLPNVPMADLWFSECAKAGLISKWCQWYGDYSKAMTDWQKARKLFKMKFRLFNREFGVWITQNVQWDAQADREG